MADNSQERRAFSRIHFDGDTQLIQNNNNWPVNLIDVSLKGLLIETPENWQADTHQPMKIHIKLDEATTIVMTVVWRHSNNGQTGFKCDHIDIDSITHLRRLVELNLGDESLLERELAALGN